MADAGRFPFARCETCIFCVRKWAWASAKAVPTEDHFLSYVALEAPMRSGRSRFRETVYAAAAFERLFCWHQPIAKEVEPHRGCAQGRNGEQMYLDESNNWLMGDDARNCKRKRWCICDWNGKQLRVVYEDGDEEERPKKKSKRNGKAKMHVPPVKDGEESERFGMLEID